MTNYSDEEILLISNDLGKEKLNFLNHTQSVERGIKDITFIAKRHPVEDRDAVMKILEKSRETIPQFKTKGDFALFQSSILAENMTENDFIDRDVENDIFSGTDTDGLATDESDIEMSN